MSPSDRFRALLAEPGFVVMPAVWDGLSAKLAAQAGFKTAFMSGSCVAGARLGGPDLDVISFAEMYNSLDMIRAAAPETLVLADGDHGYGNPVNVQRTVRAYGRMGTAAILIEDKVTPRALTAAGKPCLPREEARMKVRAAVEAAKDSGILVMARTDCRPTQGIDEAVARIEMFVEEGADILFLDSPADEAEVRRAVAAAKGRPSFDVLSPRRSAGNADPSTGSRTGSEDRDLPDRPARPGRGRDPGWTRGTARGQSGSGRGHVAGRFPHDLRLPRLRGEGRSLRAQKLGSGQRRARRTCRTRRGSLVHSRNPDPI
jgi:2-methylisocitrate lyase-like PEP mutase family enzyme